MKEMSRDEELQHQQLNLFPLHPENLFEERDVQDENVAYLFDADGGVSLNGLLGVAGGVLSPSEEEEDEEEEQEVEECGGQENDEVGSSLARTALRHREREASEEKWVVYSEVVENSNSNEAMSISTPSCRNNSNRKNFCNKLPFSSLSSWYNHHHHHHHHQGNQGLWLKLDYEEILNAWSDKSPLYIQGDSPQTVPDVLDDSLSNGLMDGDAGVFRVPDIGSSMVGGEEQAEMEGTKKGQRQARVLRYKQKRQSRLFSKRIRYEVRKLNAEKRPRMKGRFVKRN
ncbi:zinc finger protein CONSTANS-LIKE 16-like [Telopea speciosissima]|uniref:zinc finger protein CONSTANS-LIKE 16-like n=1 Tax=Telopea speciosissima TaxID=54955 RepID=UPI001CC534CF|nr:zinc finger protein CONSTANS-LIKE 16-like [Telopea speciosissima]